jgi:hypothetical protein
MMNEALPMLVGVGALILFIGIGAAIGITQRRRMREAFGSLALRTGMQVEEGNFLRAPRLTGNYRSRATQIYTYQVRSGKNSTTYTAVTMEIANPNHYTLMLRREHALDGLGKKLGMKDLEVGDSEFDSKFVVKSEPQILAPEMIRQYGNLRDALMRIPTIFVDLKDSTLRHHERGIQSNPDTLTSILELLASIADAIAASDGERVVDDPFDAPDEFASDSALDPALADDPFYGKTREPKPEYPYDPVLPTSSNAGITLPILVVFIAAITALAGAAIAVFLLTQ